MQTTAKPFSLSWRCLQDYDSPSLPPPSNPKTAMFVQQKTFAQALSNVCDIPHSQLPKPCVKGDDIAISIPDEEYDAGLEACKHNLQGRIIWPKGTAPVALDTLKSKLSTLWKSLGRWGVISLGKGCYEFVFSSVEDLRSVRSVGSWNLSPGILKLFAWSENFNPYIQHQTNAQVWVRLYGLSQEYWRKKILFAIASSVGTPICTDSISGKPMIERTFGHFARVLVDIDLASDLRHRVLVERKGYAFFVDLEYENLPDFCSYCKIPGHHVDICKKRKMVNVQKEKNKKSEPVVRATNVRQEYVPVFRATNVENIDNSEAQAADQNRTEADLELELEINEELQAIQVEQPAIRDSSNKSPEQATIHASSNKSQHLDVPIPNDDAQSSTGSQFVDATQEIDRADCNSPANSVFENTPKALLKDMRFLKESWANLADVAADENDDEDSSLNTSARHVGDGNSQIHFNANTDTSLSKAADNVNPSIDDQGFQLVTTRATKKATKSKTIRQNTYPLRSRAGTSKPFK